METRPLPCFRGKAALFYVEKLSGQDRECRIAAEASAVPIGANAASPCDGYDADDDQCQPLRACDDLIRLRRLCAVLIFPVLRDGVYRLRCGDQSSTHDDEDDPDASHDGTSFPKIPM